MESKVIEFFILLLILLCFFPVLLGFRKTHFSITADTGFVWSLIFYKDFIFVVLPAFILVFMGIDEFRTLRMADQNSIFSSSVIFLCSLFLFYILLLFFYRIMVPGRLISYLSFDSISEVDNKKHFIFAFSFLFAAVFLLLTSFFLLGYRHAVIYSIFSGEDLLRIRLDNVYASSLPTQISYLMTVAWWVAAIFSAYLLFIRKRVSFFVCMMIGLFLASSGGDKAPIIQYFMLFFMSILYFFRPKIKLSKIIIYLPIYFFLLFLLVFYVVSLQIKDMDISVFLSYLLERLGVGQMAGAYETLSLEFFVPGSWWHMIPFASFFVDYPVFSKELMLYTEGAEYDRTGVKNSFFIAEAFGIGKYFLMCFSPVIMAFSYIVKMLFLFYSIRFFFGIFVAGIYTIPFLYLSTSITGDLSSLALQKGTILLFMVLGLVYLLSIFLKPFLTSIR